MKTFKKILRITLIIIAIPIAGIIGFLIYAMASDYKPAEKELIDQSDKPTLLKDSLTISLLSWNIGYAGLDKDMDFFYDGGTKVITPEETCWKNISGIESFLKDNDTIDFILLQEIDINSKRSYKIDEYAGISEKLAGFKPYFARNYSVPFVPMPVSNPMGKVLAGIVTYSKYVPVSSSRYALPGNMGFPTQLFYMDRCFIVNRYKVNNGKELVVINTHNEAFDESGEIRKAQMEKLKEFVGVEYNSGNYVIAGGDWNQRPPDFKAAFSRNIVYTTQIGKFNLLTLESDYMPGEWKWMYDSSTPSVRTNIAAYNPDTTPTSVCDIFLISPNIESVSEKCIDLGFTNSDHNPLIVTVKLK